VIGPPPAPGFGQLRREETKEVKLSISIILRARTELLRTTIARHVTYLYYTVNYLKCTWARCEAWCDRKRMESAPG